MILMVLVLVVVVCLLLLNLATSVLVLRSVRPHEAGTRLDPRTTLPDHIVALVGREVPDLSELSLDDRISAVNAASGEPTLIGFFSTGCEPCHARAPEFSRLARDTANSLAVVTGRGADRTELVDLLQVSSKAPAAPDAEKIARAFGIDAYPTFIRVQDGRVAAAGLSVAQLAWR